MLFSTYVDMLSDFEFSTFSSSRRYLVFEFYCHRILHLSFILSSIYVVFLLGFLMFLRGVYDVCVFDRLSSVFFSFPSGSVECVILRIIKSPLLVTVLTSFVE